MNLNNKNYNDNDNSLNKLLLLDNKKSNNNLEWWRYCNYSQEIPNVTEKWLDDNPNEEEFCKNAFDKGYCNYNYPETMTKDEIFKLKEKV